MSTRKRRIEDVVPPSRVRPGDAGTSERTTAPGGGAQELLDAADDVISKALSSDSEAFLKATRQQGGE
jgi:hypothetical protein